MYRLIADFKEDWAQESESTIKLFRQLTDDSLEQKVTDDGRSIGFIAWHIVLTLGEMTGRAGLNVDAPSEDKPPPKTSSEIADAYEKAARSVSDEICGNWSDESLNDEIDAYGEKWKKGKIISALILHQAHHRGQLTVLMRQAGLMVPGVYGPSREEWVKWGLPPMK